MGPVNGWMVDFVHNQTGHVERDDGRVCLQLNGCIVDWGWLTVPLPVVNQVAWSRWNWAPMILGHVLY